MEVLDSAGRVIALGQLLGKGGEGSVYELRSTPHLVAKVYHEPLSADRAAKIALMAEIKDPQLAKLTAWPADLVRRRSGEPIGLLMPRIADHKDVHHLYSPKSRRSDFDRADWRFLVQAAANVARAFATVHQTGCVIGDVNHGGVLVAQNATVKLIDCDSFQVIRSGRQFLCEVGVETFTPPELHGRPFKGIVRTPHHDNFGLAVMVFLLLYMGRHPFAGRYLGKGDMPIEQAITEFRFAYGARRAQFQMQQPPGTPSLAIGSPAVVHLIERAFAPDAVRAGRPTALEWVGVLTELGKALKRCSINQSHWHYSGLNSCPWCAMEASTGVSLFPLHIPQTPSGSFSIDEFWKQVNAVPHPGPAPSFDVAAAEAGATPSPVAQAAVKRQFHKALGAASAALALLVGFAGLNTVALVGQLILALIVFFGVFGVVNNLGPKARLRHAAEVARAEWEKSHRSWQQLTGPERYEIVMAQLVETRRQWEGMASVRTKRLQELAARARELQLERFLDQHRLEFAKIKGVGNGNKATLEAYGIETAADIKLHAIAAVPGIGPKRQEALMTWRGSVEAAFRFDPNRSLDPKEITRVEDQVRAERRLIEQKLVASLAALREAESNAMVARQQMRPMLDKALSEMASTKANLRA